jgi:type I restriction enzyme S subunit
MSPETFLDKFDLIADAPDAVAKMKELVLELALQGKLVERNLDDEPAQELLKRVELEKKSASKTSRTRDNRDLQPVEDDAYLQIPEGWAWARLGDTGRLFNGDSVNEIGKLELAKVTDGLPFIATKDVGYGNDPFAYDNGLKVTFGNPSFKIAHANAVLICAEGGSAGKKLGVTDRDICFGNKLFANEVWSGIHHRFIFYVYQSPTFFKQFSARMTGIIGGISKSEFLSIPIPIPPEQEQKRIVAKLDELMTLCDRLEQQQKERDQKHATLSRVSLTRFSEAPTTKSLRYLFHPTYTTTPADLRKTILTLAVQGKLVPQDPNDEPGNLILQRMHSSNLGGKAEKGANEVKELEKDLPFDLPNGWSVSQLGSILLPTRGISYGVIKLGAEPKHGGVFILRCSNVRFRRIDLNGIRKITETLSQDYSRTILQGGEVLINVRGTLGGCAVVPIELKGYNIAREVAVIPVHWEILPNFLLNVIASPYFQDRVDENLRGIAYEGLNLGLLRDFLITIPPLAEQKRIVAKVDELMKLVDQLEAQLTTARATAENLLNALLADLTSQEAA